MYYGGCRPLNGSLGYIWLYGCSPKSVIVGLGCGLVRTLALSVMRGTAEATMRHVVLYK